MIFGSFCQKQPKHSHNIHNLHLNEACSMFECHHFDHVFSNNLAPICFYGSLDIWVNSHLLIVCYVNITCGMVVHLALFMPHISWFNPEHDFLSMWRLPFSPCVSVGFHQVSDSIPLHLRKHTDWWTGYAGLLLGCDWCPAMDWCPIQGIFLFLA